MEHGSQVFSQHVHSIWHVQGRALGLSQVVLPHAFVQLVINLGAPLRVDMGDRRVWLEGCHVVGIQTRPFEAWADGPVHFLGVCFRPGLCRPAAGVPAASLTNHIATVSGELGNEIHAARLRLVTAGCNGGLEGLVSTVGHHLVLGGAAESTRVREVVRGLASAGHASIGRLAASAGVSHKRLLNGFAAEVGVTPKLLDRLLRFRRVIGGLGRTERIDWAMIAAACGYADQAHLVRDFRQFAGTTPARHRRADRVGTSDRILDGAFDGTAQEVRGCGLGGVTRLYRAPRAVRARS